LFQRDGGASENGVRQWREKGERKKEKNRKKKKKKEECRRGRREGGGKRGEEKERNVRILNSILIYMPLEKEKKERRYSKVLAKSGGKKRKGEKGKKGLGSAF